MLARAIALSALSVAFIATSCIGDDGVDGKNYLGIKLPCGSSYCPIVRSCGKGLDAAIVVQAPSGASRTIEVFARRQGIWKAVGDISSQIEKLESPVFLEEFLSFSDKEKYISVSFGEGKRIVYRFDGIKWTAEQPHREIMSFFGPGEKVKRRIGLVRIGSKAAYCLVADRGKFFLSVREHNGWILSKEISDRVGLVWMLPEEKRIVKTETSLFIVWLERQQKKFRMRIIQLSEEGGKISEKGSDILLDMSSKLEDFSISNNNTILINHMGGNFVNTAFTLVDFAAGKVVHESPPAIRKHLLCFEWNKKGTLYAVTETTDSFGIELWRYASSEWKISATFNPSRGQDIVGAIQRLSFTEDGTPIVVWQYPEWQQVIDWEKSLEAKDTKGMKASPQKP